MTCKKDCSKKSTKGCSKKSTKVSKSTGRKYACGGKLKK